MRPRPFALAAYALLLALGGCSECRDAASAGCAPTHENPALGSPLAARTEHTLVMTIGSSPVYEPEYRFWLKYVENYYKDAHGLSEIDWSAEQNGTPLREYFRSSAIESICRHRATENKARELGVSLSPQELAELRTAREKGIRTYGSESEYRRIVEVMYGSEEVFDYLTRMKYLGDRLFARLYGEQGQQCSDQCVAAYAEQQRFMAVKYIFLAKPLDPAQQPQRARLVDEILARLNASREPDIFDELMHEYSQDESLHGYPDGRLFTPGAKDPAFERAYRQLAVGQHSGLVQTADGDYIILRMPIFPEMTADALGNSLRHWVAYEHLFKKQIDDWCRQLPIKHAPASTPP